MMFTFSLFELIWMIGACLMIGCGLMKWACDADERERRELKRENKAMRAELKKLEKRFSADEA